MNREHPDGILRALHENPEGMQEVAQRFGFEDGETFLNHLGENPDAVRKLNHYFEYIVDDLFKHPDKRELFRFLKDTLSDEMKVAMVENEEVPERVFKQHYRDDAWVLILLDELGVKHRFGAFEGDHYE